MPEFKATHCRKNGKNSYIGNNRFHFFVFDALVNDSLQALYVAAALTNKIGEMRFRKMYPFMGHNMIFLEAIEHHAHMKTDNLLDFFQ